MFPKMSVAITAKLLNKVFAILLFALAYAIRAGTMMLEMMMNVFKNVSSLIGVRLYFALFQINMWINVDPIVE